MAIDVPHQPLLTATSGSVGDVVFSRNRHGPYTRARTAPFDPSSARQLAVRAALSQCVTAWNATLTESERRGWDAYALAVRRSTAIARSTNAGGLAMFVRANVPRIQAAVGGIPRVDQAPASFTDPPLTPITRVVLNFVDDTLHPFFDESDPWVTETDAALIFQASAPRPTTVNFFNGPYQFADTILGHPVLPPTSPGTIPLPVPAGTNTRVFVRFRLTLSDSRLTEPIRLPADPGAQVAPIPILATFVVGPPNTVDVLFDQLIRNQFHDPGNWRVRFNNTRWTTTIAGTDRDVVRLFLSVPTLSPGIDAVSYLPPPDDVHSLLNGLPAPPIRNFPIT